jgi:hypothetical protein
MAAPSKSAGNRMRCCRASCRYPLSRHSPDFDSRRPSIARQAYWTRLNRLACPHTATFAHGRTMVAGLRGSAGLAGYCRYVPGVREICIDRVSNLIRIPAWSLRLGALDSPVEEAGFEPSVPQAKVSSVFRAMQAKRPEDSCIHFAAGAAVQLDLFCPASHSMERMAHVDWVG